LEAAIWITSREMLLGVINPSSHIIKAYARLPDILESRPLLQVNDKFRFVYLCHDSIVGSQSVMVLDTRSSSFQHYRTVNLQVNRVNRLQLLRQFCELPLFGVTSCSVCGVLYEEYTQPLNE
jgi:hypothetical protein